MRVLMVTPMVDEKHPILGFIPSWVNALAKRVDKLHVFTLKHNEKTRLLENVTVYSLDSKSGKLSKILYLNNTMIKLLRKEEVNVMFCHMYPSLALWTAPYAKLFGVPVIWWRTHGSVSLTARIVHFLADKVVTASKESFRIRSNKIIITGHGIDTDRFKPAKNLERKNKSKKIILSVGRISPIKNYETFIKAADILVNEKGMKDLEFVIVGGVPMASQEEYYEKLKKMVKELELEDYVKFVGAVPHTEVVKYYQQCDIFVSTSQTGSVDKVVLEAMACEKPVLVCNETFRELLRPYENLCLFRHKNFKDMAEKLKNIIANKHLWEKIGIHNREKVISNHSISHLADSLTNIFREVIRCT